MIRVRKIISGGQTGADRAALDYAISRNISHGGHCPAGRRSERGRIPQIYSLTETYSSGYKRRTRLNIDNSDGTLILCVGQSPGSAYTYQAAKRGGKPVLRVQLKQETSVEPIRAWLVEHRIEVLNVAGTRESKAPGIGAAVFGVLAHVLDAPR